MKPFPGYKPDWRWGTAEGSRDFDRLSDREMTFREKLEWLEQAEMLTLRLREQRERIHGRSDPEDRRLKE